MAHTVWGNYHGEEIQTKRFTTQSTTQSTNTSKLDKLVYSRLSSSFDIKLIKLQPKTIGILNDSYWTVKSAFKFWYEKFASYCNNRVIVSVDGHLLGSIHDLARNCENQWAFEHLNLYERLGIWQTDFHRLKVARILEIHLSNKACYDFKRMTDTFVWFSPVLNPILYSLMGRNFRQKLKLVDSHQVKNSQKVTL